MKTPCPICGSDKNIVPIDYGYPRAPDEMNEELGVVRYGKKWVRLGGCMSEDEEYYCTTCQLEF
jgi:hypothetical protein